MSKLPQGAGDVGRRVDEQMVGLDLRAAASREVAEAAERVAALGREAVAHLVRRAVGPNGAREAGAAREKAAALLGCLTGQAARWASREVGRHLDLHPLNPTEQMWAMALLRRLDEAASGAGPEAPALADSMLEDETELLLWRDEFASLSPDEQQSALAPVLQDGNPAFLRLLEAAMSLQLPAVDGAVASGLSRFATPAALPLLRELMRRADPAVRKQARASLASLERQGVDIGDLFVAGAESEEPVRAALVTVPGGDGRMVALVARGHGPGRVRFAAVVVDPVEAGIANAWGETGMSESDLRQRLAEFAEKAGEQLVSVALAAVQALVAAAEDYAVKRGRALPPDYLVWRRCIGRPRDGSQGAAEELPVVFGPACSQCGVRVRGSDLVRGGLIAGRAALCSRCAAGPLACAGCGRPVNRHADDLFARPSADGSRVEFLCPRCEQRRG